MRTENEIKPFRAEGNPVPAIVDHPETGTSALEAMRLQRVWFHDRRRLKGR
jgi:hypothetical protein